MVLWNLTYRYNFIQNIDKYFFLANFVFEHLALWGVWSGKGLNPYHTLDNVRYHSMVKVYLHTFLSPFLHSLLHSWFSSDAVNIRGVIPVNNFLFNSIDCHIFYFIIKMCQVWPKRIKEVPCRQELLLARIVCSGSTMGQKLAPPLLNSLDSLYNCRALKLQNSVTQVILTESWTI